MPFTLKVPVEAPASAETRRVRVVAVDEERPPLSRVIAVGGVATFTFPHAPRRVRVVVAPEDVSDAELDDVQTVNTVARGTLWMTAREVTLLPLVIPRAIWRAWSERRRPFTIRGRVLTDSGAPLAHGRVTAFDVDWWWWWRSRERLGEVTTDAHGRFELQFDWTCGHSPTRWWSGRDWDVDYELASRLLGMLPRDAHRERIVAAERTPGFRVFEQLLRRAAGTDDEGLAAPFDFVRAELIRQPLIEKLGRRELLDLWPWRSWTPWLDTAPDVVFRVTHERSGRTVTVVNEGVDAVRRALPAISEITVVTDPPRAIVLRGGEAGRPSLPVC